MSATALIVSLLVVPTAAQGNYILMAAAPVIRTFGLWFSALFGLIAAVKWLTSKSGTGGSSVLENRAGRSQGQTTAMRPTTEYRHAPRRVNVGRSASRPEPQSAAAPAGAPPSSAAVAAAPTNWSLELLRSLDWKRFEEVVAAYFREKGFRCETIACGPDGGVDGRLFFGDIAKPVGVVQCKAWTARPVGVGPVRELLGVMAHEQVPRGYFATTGTFTDAAVRFAGVNSIMLISGTDFLTSIAKMDDDQRTKLLAVSTESDYTVPSCPSCGIKLFRKRFRTGSTAWVCRRYPACKTRIWTKADAS